MIGIEVEERLKQVGLPVVVGSEDHGDVIIDMQFNRATYRSIARDGDFSQMQRAPTPSRAIWVCSERWSHGSISAFTEHLGRSDQSFSDRRRGIGPVRRPS